MAKESKPLIENFIQDKLLRAAGLTIFALLVLLGVRSCSDMNLAMNTENENRHGGITINNPYVQSDAPATPIATTERFKTPLQFIEEYVNLYCPQEQRWQILNYLSQNPELIDKLLTATPNERATLIYSWCATASAPS